MHFGDIKLLEANHDQKRDRNKNSACQRDQIYRPILFRSQMRFQIFETDVNGAGNEKVGEGHHEGEDAARGGQVGRLRYRREEERRALEKIKIYFEENKHNTSI